MIKIIFATANNGKLKEVKKLFEDTSFKIVGAKELNFDKEVEETGSTFFDNALIKVKAIHSIFNSPVIADDSGLTVDQLSGRPGVFSARYAGDNCTYDDNNNKVLSELEKFHEPHKAKFICSAVFFDGEQVIHAEGFLPGKIIKEKRGVQGFGYDPIFIPDGHNITLAEMDLELKSLISHRAKAFGDLKNKMLELFSSDYYLHDSKS